MQAPDAVAVCRLKLACLPDVQFNALPLSSLQFFLNGESTLVHTLYELLFNSCTRIILRDPRPESRIRAGAPSGKRVAAGRIPRRGGVIALAAAVLRRISAAPGIFRAAGAVLLCRADGILNRWRAFESEVEILFMIGPFERNDRYQPLELGINAKTFRLNCTPIVNLFQQTAEAYPARSDAL